MPKRKIHKGFYVTTKRPAINAMVSVSVEELLEVAKQAKQKQKEFKVPFFVHLSPDVSFYFEDRKRK